RRRCPITGTAVTARTSYVGSRSSHTPAASKPPGGRIGGCHTDGAVGYDPSAALNGDIVARGAFFRTGRGVILAVKSVHLRGKQSVHQGCSCPRGRIGVCSLC